MNLNDLNHASLTSCDQDASSALLCRYRLIRAARICHHEEELLPRSLTAHEPGAFASLVGCSRKRAHVRRSSPFDFGGSHGANAPLRVARGCSGPEGSPALRCATERAIVRSGCARLRSEEPHMYFELDPIQIIWNCVVKVP